MSEIRRVGVVGCGLMGSGIAEVCARSGLDVTITEVNEDALAAGRGRITKSLDRALAKGKLDADAHAATLGRLRFTGDIGDFADVDIAIEAVAEVEQIKVDIFRALDKTIVNPRAILASNTSSIPIAEIGSWTRHPDRVLGLHFFSPVPVMKLVEVVVALDTAEETISVAEGFASGIGKRPIQTKDRSGFIVNMLLVPYLMAAVRMYEDGFATREDIDEGMRLGCGHPMGPLTLCDFIGLDVLYAVCDSLYEEFKRPEYAPPPLLKRMVVSGHHGRKAGRGFYEYESS
jgi:3-hydroxybutyryl-CoA dehydrogenase